MAISENISTLDTSTGDEDKPKNGGGDQAESPPVIAAKESRAVFTIRVILVVVLVASTIGVALWIFHYTTRSEINTFENKFKDDAIKVVDALGLNLDQTLGSFNQFSVTLVSYARYTNSSWPFVTHPDFALLGAKMLGLSKSFVVSQFLLVSTEQRQEWESYSVANDAWIARAQEIQASDENFHGPILTEFATAGQIHDNDGKIVEGDGPYLPSWQSAPVVPFFPPYNWNAFSTPWLKRAAGECMDRQRVVISETSNIPNLNNPDEVAAAESFGEFAKVYLKTGEDASAPYINIFYPIIDQIDSVKIKDEFNATSVGILGMLIYWNKLITDVLPYGSDGMVAVFENTCGQVFTYELNGPDATYLGLGDLHDSQYDYLHESVVLHELSSFTNPEGDYTGAALTTEFCTYTLHLYPSDTMKSNHTTSIPATFTAIAVLIFAFTSAVFVLYDYLVERRQRTVMKSATLTNSIVSHLFPATVRDRLFQSKGEDASPRFNLLYGRRRSNESSGPPIVNTDKETPIADFFPEATVLIADISGFTAWSSTRGPTQVFTLLEALYGAFDEIARKRKVFKVETIGDSYVAVTGVPTAQKDHALIMARFASEMQTRMVELTRELEVTLGPGTGDLMLRTGIHSGPVTAGVLRGDRSRFQLFGDTINTASRMESTGVPGKIQISFGTASLLEGADRNEWVSPRDDLVEAKGKGKMQTFWLDIPKPIKNPSYHSSPSTVSTNSSRMLKFLKAGTNDAKEFRRVEWYTDTLLKCLCRIVAQNESTKESVETVHVPDFPATTSPVDELMPVVDFSPPHAKEATSSKKQPEMGEVSPQVADQLRGYVRRTAYMHGPHAFHNFEHASHVGMSVVKLLNSLTESDENDKEINAVVMTLQDPLVKFSCIFSALIHDVSHPGVTNQQLVNENDPLAVKYEGMSVAEQNSIDAAWDVFLEDEYADLRATLCPTSEALAHFRHIVVNAVIATDITDKTMSASRIARWNEAFGGENDKRNPEEATKQKATVVLEHLIQASDVSHTMQHWHIFRKWNEGLFKETQTAYQEGRSAQDPAEYWYEGELKFFDVYVIPLAQKISECGVFGSSSKECLQNAKKIRQEWEERGQEIVTAMVEGLYAY